MNISVDYESGREESPDDYPSMEAKVEKAKAIAKEGLETYDTPSIMWTGGKDSTLVLQVVREAAEEGGYELPPVVFIDHFQHFDAVHEFVDRWTDRLDLDLIVASNDDVGALADEPGEDIAVSDLDERNQRHVREVLEYEDDTFPFLLDTYVGNHLLKTVALNDVLEEYEFDAVFSGIRWDEQEARADETFFSPRHDDDIYPVHDRVHPILQFSEADVWTVTWNYIAPRTVEGYPEGYVPESADDLPEGVTMDDLPVSPKYFAGYRSLGSEVSTDKSDEDPAWLQDIEGTEERGGRAQDKEDLMERLRDLGYM
ncbi:nodulation protein [Halobacteriales archaeon SW_7_68_16]|nr:MAG: nodulation protein [Halobacteriales archaeon SW_7_68_16]